VATRKVCKNLQRGNSSGELEKNLKNNLERELTTLIKICQEKQYKLDPVSFFVSYFWGKRLNAVAINEAPQIVYILENTRSTDRHQGFPEAKEAEANEQHKSIRVIGALRANAQTWEFQQIFCGWPRKSLHLLEEGQNHLIVCFAYLCQMIHDDSFFLSFL